jgi:hypothetical protein
LVLFQTMFHNELHDVMAATHSGRTIETCRQFKADIDHLFAQILLDNSPRTKRDSVPISLDFKARWIPPPPVKRHPELTHGWSAPLTVDSMQVGI